MNKPANNFGYKQVICQAKDNFWPDKKPVWSDKIFFLLLEIKNKIHLRHFGISLYSLCQNVGCKFEWLKSKVNWL